MDVSAPVAWGCRGRDRHRHCLDPQPIGIRQHRLDVAVPVAEEVGCEWPGIRTSADIGRLLPLVEDVRYCRYGVCP
jgi:hypothetical protein